MVTDDHGAYKEVMEIELGKQHQLCRRRSKEQYRTMREYQRKKSLRNVVFLTAQMGVRSRHCDMAELLA